MGDVLALVGNKGSGTQVVGVVVVDVGGACLKQCVDRYSAWRAYGAVIRQQFLDVILESAGQLGGAAGKPCVCGNRNL